MRVIVTRPVAQALPWAQGLRDAGLDAAALPLIDIAAPTDPRAAARAWATRSKAALVFFVSPNAVEHGFALVPDSPDWPADTLAGSPGPGTTAALRAHGVAPGAIVAPPHDSPSFDSQALWHILQHRRWQGRRVMIVRGDGGRDWLAQRLRDAGAEVEFVTAYQRRPAAPDAAGRRLLAQALAHPGQHLWLFSSSESIAHLQALAPGIAVNAAMALATHPRIADNARSVGFGDVRCCAPSMAAVVQAVRGWSIQSPTP